MNAQDLAHSTGMKPAGRSGRLGGAMSIRLTTDQLAYLEQRADVRGTSVSEELRATVDEAMIATVEQRRKRQRQVQSLIEAEDFEALAALNERDTKPPR